MKHLVYKELKLSIHQFFYVLPFILAALLLIPNWMFMLVFMYFFWISVPNIYSAYIAQGDYQFMSVLPVQRDDIVKAKAYSMYILEGLHLFSAVIFGLIHIMLYGSANIFFDINLAFFGVGILMFGVFNVVFLPMYFKTAQFFGKPTIYGTVATLIYGFVFEFGVIKYQFMRDIFEGTFLVQLIVFIISIILAVIFCSYAINLSQKRFNKIDI